MYVQSRKRHVKSQFEYWYNWINNEWSTLVEPRLQSHVHTALNRKRSLEVCHIPGEWFFSFHGSPAQTEKNIEKRDGWSTLPFHYFYLQDSREKSEKGKHIPRCSCTPTRRDFHFFFTLLFSPLALKPLGNEIFFRAFFSLLPPPPVVSSLIRCETAFIPHTRSRTHATAAATAQRPELLLLSPTIAL